MGRGHEVWPQLVCDRHEGSLTCGPDVMGGGWFFVGLVFCFCLFFGFSWGWGWDLVIRYSSVTVVVFFTLVLPGVE